jgi:hypothetical protein
MAIQIKSCTHTESQFQLHIDQPYALTQTVIQDPARNVAIFNQERFQGKIRSNHGLKLWLFCSINPFYLVMMDKSDLDCGINVNDDYFDDGNVN